MKHTDLIGMPKASLRALAPQATHQQVKGGLYAYLGPLMDSQTKQQAVDANGKLLVVWLHVFPYAKSVWQRPADESYKFEPLDEQ